MNILLVSLTCSPDNVSTAQLMAGFATSFKAKGHDVRVITTTPHYHPDAGLEAKQPLRNWWGRLVRRSTLDGVEIYHVWMPPRTAPTPVRILSWIGFHAMSVIVGLAIRFRPEVVLACTPPLTNGLSGWLLAALKGARLVFNVQELYPDIAINMGVIRNPALVWFFRRVERFIYRHAAAVTSITEAMCAKIRERVDPSKVHLIANYVELGEDAAPTPLPHPAHRPLTVTYAGNMGVPQYLGPLLRSLKAPNAAHRVLFVGDGGDRANLVAEAERENVRGVEFRGYQPLSAMPAIYAESDLFYVGQTPEMAGDGVPSKIYRILGARKPLLVVTKVGGDLAAFVRESGGGVALEVPVGGDADVPAALAAEIAKFAADPQRLTACGEAGRRHVEQNYSRDKIVSDYLSLFASLNAPEHPVV